MKTSICIALSLAIILNACEKPSKMYHRPDRNGDDQLVPDAEIGKPLPKWQEGCLDIHYINSARGECTFYILPDGTTMLVDAGETTLDIAPKPNASVPAYEVYGKYIKHFMPQGHDNLDYMSLSHFHIDHMGSNSIREAAADGYVHTGVSAVYDLVKFDRLIDRGYPNYEADPKIGAPDTDAMPNYRLFVKKLEDEKKVTLSRFEVGSSSQFALLYKPSEYECRITNIVGNGYVLGKDESGNPIVKTGGVLNGGNPNSCGFHLAYGNFDYIACGDLTGSAQNLMASNYYSNYITNLEVFKGNHHLTYNSWGSGMQSAGFTAQVVAAMSNGAADASVVEYVINLPSDVFLTNLPQKVLDAYPVFSQCKGYNGHIVVRVATGGGQFFVYLLDDTDILYSVKAIYGPYISYD